MEKLGIKDTIAWKIFDQLTSHLYPNTSFSESDFLKIYNAFIKIGGSWERLIYGGDIDQFGILMDLLKAHQKIKKHPKKYGLKK